MRRACTPRWVSGLACCLLIAWAPLAASGQPKPATPVPDQPGLRVPEPTYKKAIVIVVEENQSQSESASWGRISDALADIEMKDVVPYEVRKYVVPVINAAREFAEFFKLPVARVDEFIKEIDNSARREAFKMMGSVAGAVGGQLGLPQSSCARGLLDTMARQSVQSGKDPFKVLKDQGEEYLGNCLKQMASPYYDRVVLLTDAQATFENFKTHLRSLTTDGYIIDALLDVHGCGSPRGANSPLNNSGCKDEKVGLWFTGPVATKKKLESLQTLFDSPTPQLQARDVPGIQFRQPGQGKMGSPQIVLESQSNAEKTPRLGPRPTKPRLNAVYAVSCWGSDFNPYWLMAGAKAANGARELNYYVLLSPIVFLDHFTRGGKSLRDAAQMAYDTEKTLLNGKTYSATLDLRPALNALFPPPTAGADLIAAACPEGKRAKCTWDFTLGSGYGDLVNKLLGTKYGHRKDQPINNIVSSQRLQGDVDVRRAGQ